MKPYYEDADTTLYLGDMREVLPGLQLTVDVVVADPPYEETALEWDRWPDGWLQTAAATSASMWCFGSMRLFGVRFAEFLEAGWTYSQDVVWQKHNGSGFQADRFRRVHEHAVHWYRGPWSGVHHEAPMQSHLGPDRGPRRAARAGAAHLGTNNGHDKPWVDDGTRLMTSVIEARSAHGRAIHPTEKPVPLLDPLIRYGCPAGGTVLDPFAGSGSTAVAARLSGRRSVLVERRERFCEAIAGRLSQDVLPLEMHSREPL